MRSALSVASGLVFAIALAACTDPPAGHGVRVDPSSSSCGTCHARQYREWQDSPLSRGTSSPVFAALVERVEARWGSSAAETCVACHQPRHGGPDEPGVGCVSCHAAVSLRDTRDALLRIDLTVPLAGPFGDTDAHGAHGTRGGGLVSDSQLCASCHEVSGPALFVETTYSEFVSSPQAAAGMGCIDCHMRELAEEVPLTVLGGPARRGREHGFVGLDPPWNATPADAARASERTRALLQEALELELTVADGRAVVSLANVGAAHGVPTGVAFLRDIWVDVTVIDASGAALWHEPRVLELGSRVRDGELDVALIVHADRVESRALAPGERREVVVELPRSLPGSSEVEVRLRAVAIRKEVLEALELEGLMEQMPRHEVARVVRPLR